MDNCSKILYAFFIFLALVAPGCNFPFLDYKQSLTVGNPEGMQVRSHDINLNSQFQKEESLIIDLDRNGKDDLLVKSVWSFSAGGNGSYVLFEGLNISLELKGQMLVDTSFFRLETERDTFNDGDSIMINKFGYHSCKRSHEEDRARPVNDTPLFKLMPSQADEVINAKTPFQNANYELRNWGNSTSTGFTTQTSPTEYSKRIDFYDNSCGAFPEGTPFFIVFRMNFRGIFRFGWIKVQYEGSHNITILETAIQE